MKRKNSFNQGFLKPRFPRRKHFFEVEAFLELGLSLNQGLHKLGFLSSNSIERDIIQKGDTQGLPVDSRLQTSRPLESRYQHTHAITQKC